MQFGFWQQVLHLLHHEFFPDTTEKLGKLLGVSAYVGNALSICSLKKPKSYQKMWFMNLKNSNKYAIHKAIESKEIIYQLKEVISLQEFSEID